MSGHVFYNRHGAIVTPPPGAVIRPRRAVYALLIRQEHALLIWPGFTNGIPDLPGGGIEPGENLDTALRREWQEETGASFPAHAVHAATHQHIRGFHAECDGEFWIYDQTFHLYRDHTPLPAARRWPNPEGNSASWEPVAHLPALRLNRAHWHAIARWLPPSS